MDRAKSITVKNPLYMELPDITILMELSGTTYRFSGVYDGHKSLPSKSHGYLKVCSNGVDKNHIISYNVTNRI